jgi:hypothetical protein
MKKVHVHSTHPPAGQDTSAKQCASLSKNGYEWKAAETTQRQAKKGPGDKKLQTNIQPRVDDREAQK